MAFSRQEHWSGVPLPSPYDYLNQVSLICSVVAWHELNDSPTTLEVLCISAPLPLFCPGLTRLENGSWASSTTLHGSEGEFWLSAHGVSGAVLSTVFIHLILPTAYVIETLIIPYFMPVDMEAQGSDASHCFTACRS